MRGKILIVDDDPDIITLLNDRLESLGYMVFTAEDGVHALELLDQDPPDLLLLDLEMPRLAGLGLLRTIMERRRMPAAGAPPTAATGSEQGRSELDFPVIVMTAFGTITAAVEAMKSGAYDFVTKPFDMDHLSIVIGKALERETLKRQVECLRSEMETRYASIIGKSPCILSVVESARRAANSDVSVLLLGESGTGKELFARSLHQWSPRHAMPFVVINCVALTDTLLENELFGHEKGAFTGADRMEKGKIEMAEGGTLFLDEIGDMPLSLQAKLLRVLQDKEFQRVGGTRTIKVDIRVIAATNKDIKQAVRAGQFREDLFYRLNVVTMNLPPLRERTDDIPLLAEFFLKRHARDAKRPSVHLTEDALSALSHYAWPGNIRELDNALARAVVLCPTDAIDPQGLALSAEHVSRNEGNPEKYLDLPYHESMDQHSRALIMRALHFEHGNQTRAAERLQLQRTYLARLIRQKNLSAHPPRS